MSESCVCVCVCVYTYVYVYVYVYDDMFGPSSQTDRRIYFFPKS